MTRLPAAMQQQHRLAGIAEDVGDQPVAGGAFEHRGRGLQMLHGRSLQEFERGRLEHLVADRDHVVAARDVEPAPVRNQRGELVRRAGDVVLGADRDQGRRADACEVLAPQRLARAAQAGGERLQVGAGLLGEGAEALAHRIGDVSERRRFERRRAISSRRPALSTSRMPTPPRITERTQLGLARRQHRLMRAPSE